MKTAALLGTLSVGHRLPAGARLLCSPGQELTAGAPLAEVHAPRRVRAVPLKHLGGAAVGDRIPAGTTVGGDGGWRGRRQAIEWDARVVALNPASGHAFLSGPEERTEIRARISGVVGPTESGRNVEITGEGLALYCPLARGPSVFGNLALGCPDDESRPSYPDATILAMNSDLDPADLASPEPENLAGLILPGLPKTWLARETGAVPLDSAPDPAPATFAVIEAVTPSKMPASLWSVLEAFSGSPASLAVDPECGTGELVVSGTAGDADVDWEAVRGFGPDGIITGRRSGDTGELTVRVSGGRLLEGVRVLAGQETQVLAAVNVERVVSTPSPRTGRG